MSADHCEVCGKALPVRRGPGRIRRYHAGACTRAAEGMAAIARAIEADPSALLYIAEQLEGIETDRDRLTDHELRRIRAALFTAASRGRRLAPGSSGRYARRKG